MDKLPSAEEVLARGDRYRLLCRNVFCSYEGKELIQMMKEIFVEGKLYCDNDRDTAYFLGQRDFVLELADKAKPRTGEAQLNGEQTNE